MKTDLETYLEEISKEVDVKVTGVIRGIKERMREELEPIRSGRELISAIIDLRQTIDLIHTTSSRALASRVTELEEEYEQKVTLLMKEYEEWVHLKNKEIVDTYVAI